MIPSKQRPRKISMQGEDGRDYAFLLKGHEDLRQDERVMQLFGQVRRRFIASFRVCLCCFFVCLLVWATVLFFFLPPWTILIALLARLCDTRDGYVDADVRAMRRELLAVGVVFPWEPLQCRGCMLRLPRHITDIF